MGVTDMILKRKKRRSLGWRKQSTWVCFTRWPHLYLHSTPDILFHQKEKTMELTFSATLNEEHVFQQL